MRYKKKPKTNLDIKVIYDDRENMPWLFISKHFPLRKKRLKVGDYTLEGFEDKVAIEKKSGFAELLSNLTVGNRQRFERYLKRLSKYPVKVIIVESPFLAVTISVAVATLKRKSPSRLSDSTIYFWMAKITAYYGIPIMFVGGKAREQAVIQIIKQCRQKAEEL